MNEVLDINDIELIEKLQFQFIYIKSSYLLGTVSSMENELEKLKKENKIMKMELEKTQQLVEELRKKVDGNDQKNNKESNNNEKDNIK
jgi:regulator of replication initiation timing